MAAAPALRGSAVLRGCRASVGKSHVRRARCCRYLELRPRQDTEGREQRKVWGSERRSPRYPRGGCGKMREELQVRGLGRLSSQPSPVSQSLPSPAAIVYLPLLYVRISRSHWPVLSPLSPPFLPAIFGSYLTLHFSRGASCVHTQNTVQSVKTLEQCT